MSPAERLRAAANLLRAAAEAAFFQASWHSVSFAEGADVRTPSGTILADTDSIGTAAYIALMDPAVGVALADWLDAERVNTENPKKRFRLADPHALAVADALGVP